MYETPQVTSQIFGEMLREESSGVARVKRYQRGCRATRSSLSVGWTLGLGTQLIPVCQPKISWAICSTACSSASPENPPEQTPGLQNRPQRNCPGRIALACSVPVLAVVTAARTPARRAWQAGALLIPLA